MSSSPGTIDKWEGPTLVDKVCQAILPDIYLANQEDFELDGYLLDDESRDLVIRLASHILCLILRNLSAAPTDALLEDWLQSLERVFPGKSGLKKVLADAVAIQYSMHDLETLDTFLSRHSKSVSTFADNLPSLTKPPTPAPPESKDYLPPASHVAIELGEIALCEVMQSISVYADDHHLLDKSVKADKPPILKIESVLPALQQDPDFEGVCKSILFPA